MRVSKINKNLIDSYGDIDLIQFLLSNFTLNVPLRIQETKNFIDDLNDKSVMKSLHVLKNLFGNIGAESAAEFCQMLEDDVKKHGCLFIKDELLKLSSEFEIVQKELQVIVAEKMRINTKSSITSK